MPPKWLRNPDGGSSLLRWTLLFTSSEPRDLLEAYGLANLWGSANRSPRVGVTIHGARRMAEAEAACGHLAGTTARHLGRELTSYGLLVDDLHVYRAIVDKRPVGLVHPQSPAARCLRDVAMLLLTGIAFYLILQFHVSDEYNIRMREGVIVSGIASVFVIGIDFLVLQRHLCK